MHFVPTTLSCYFQTEMEVFYRHWRIVGVWAEVNEICKMRRRQYLILQYTKKLTVQDNNFKINLVHYMYLNNPEVKRNN